MTVSIAAIPYNPILQTGNGQNLLTWTIVAGATTYSVQRSTDGVSWTVVGTPAINSYVDSAVTVGTNYFYQVASVTTAGTSAYAPSFPTSITPCLPGQINLGYLRYFSKLKADKLNSQYQTDDEWNFNINQSANELYDVLITKFGDQYFLSPPVIFNTTNGTSIYPLPDGALYSNAPALYKLAGVDVGINASNNQWFTLPRFNWIDRNRYATLQLAGTVQSVFGLAYCPFGGNLYFIPVPSAQIVRLWYIQVLTQMLLDTDMMPFSISGWSEYVIVDAAMKGMQKEESLEKWSSLNQSKMALLERIETTAANRDVGQSNTVSNTRARAGDQNFGGMFGGFSGWGAGGGAGWG